MKLFKRRKKINLTLKSGNLVTLRYLYLERLTYKPRTEPAPPRRGRPPLTNPYPAEQRTTTDPEYFASFNTGSTYLAEFSIDEETYNKCLSLI